MSGVHGIPAAVKLAWMSALRMAAGGGRRAAGGEGGSDGGYSD